MSDRIDAIFEHGVFRPEVPVNIPEGERVVLGVERLLAVGDDLDDVRDLLDLEFVHTCREAAVAAPSLPDVRNALSVFQGAFSDTIAEERDER